MKYPSYRVDVQVGQPQRYLCIASPEHAVEIFETTDPHNYDPLGFEYRVLRTRHSVKRCEKTGAEMHKEDWFKSAAEMMLTHLGSIRDLVQICDMRRELAQMTNGKVDYKRVIETLQDVKPSRRQMVKRRLEQGTLPLLG